MKESCQTRTFFILFTLFLLTLINRPLYAQSYPVETMVQTGHSSAVHSVCFSHDAKYVLSTGAKKAILWDLTTGRQVRVFSGVDHCVDWGIFFEDDKRIGLSCKVYDIDRYNKTMIYTIFDITTGQLIERKKMYHNFIPQTMDKNMMITNRKVVVINNEAYNITSCFLQEKSRKDSTRFELYLITIDSTKLVQSFIGHQAQSYSSCFSKDGQYFFSGGADGKALFWDVATGKLIHSFILNKYSILDVSLSDDGRYAATCNATGDIVIYDINTGEMLNHFASQAQAIGSVDFNSNNKNVLASSLLPKIWDLKSIKIIDVLDFRNDIIADSMLVYRGDIILPSKLYGKKKKRSSFVDRNFFDALYSPDNSSIATGSFSNTLNLWDANSGVKTDSLKLFRTTIFGLDYSPDGQFIAACSRDNNVIVYDIINKKKVAEISNGREDVYSVAYSPDGSMIAFVKDGYPDMKIIDTETYKISKIIKFAYGMMLSVDFSDDGRYIAVSGTDTRPSVVDLEKSKILKFPIAHKHGIKAVRFYQGSDYLFTAGYDNVIQQWDFSKRKVIRTYKGHNGSVNSIDFISEKNYLISGSDDGSIKIWNIENGELLLSLIGKSKTEYLAYTPANYYFSTKSANKGIHFVQGLKTYEFEQFDLKYNRPDIVLSQLGYADKSLVEAYHQAYLKRLKKMNFTEDMLKDDFHLPEIKIDNFEEMPTIMDQGSIEIKLDLKDSKYKLDRINVWVNDVAVYGTNGISLRDKSVRSYQTNLKVNLVKGKNKVQVSVLNQAGAESYKETFEIECKAGKSKPDLYLITIGESKFKDSKFNLTYAAKDAQDIASLFAKSKNYEKVITKTLTNEQVTKENITALRSFLDQAGINDEVMIFIAGHGVLDENLDYFFASYDMDFNNPSQRGIAYEDLEGLLDGIKPLKKVLLIDACHSGEIDKEEVELLAVNEEVGAEGIQFRAVGNTVKPKLGMQNTSELTKALFIDLRKGTGATVISSAGGGEYAMESGEWKNGLFTYCLINGIQSKDADLNNDGEIWLKELQHYVQTQVTELSGGKQQPTSRIENSVLDYRVW
ncbi:MAG: hypothetical protein DRI71_07905 [Bacteroidetes bacterium]|nr:MAG: hypothetical protein DRI71_07905 [Bacteroidota bacterium]